jgi:Flp pilus assembly protein TadD
VIIFVVLPFEFGFWYGATGLGSSSVYGNDKGTAEATADQEQLKAHLQNVAATPQDTQAILAVADDYESMYKAGEGKGNEYLLDAATYLEKVIEVDPTYKGVYVRLADLYMNEEVPPDYHTAVTVLNKAAKVDPNNPEVFWGLGFAQNSLGQYCSRPPCLGPVLAACS